MPKLMNSKTLIAATAVVALTGCATTDPYDPYSRSEPTGAAKGAGMGGLAGAAAGAALGSLSANAGRGALIGLVGGALVGAAVGDYMEQQRLDFERELADEIRRGDIRVRKLSDDRLIVGMTSATTFDVDSAQVKPGFYSTMDKIASIVNQYGKTQLAVAGFTDDTGSAEYNMKLSERRADAVRSRLMGDGVTPQRVSAYGYGKNNPIASNASEVGRSLNRRVEITIIPIVAS
ncbi:OmpA family protein [Thiorhodovibrio frisius]|uniref:Outer membrane protein/peptidoglycan-associated (Lipo)protein n=1 Tax=Thiorhodovibrio frisius TaxID=631362 RepID=H8YXQ9_9GAMM|nr:OmpA family protein [Thiorhodovibrio frisius]EIC23235.1 outer membrane protein/peptidoglycan-associated (lipo)protein [Thiorhodovibrio frisius]WPL23689.1 Inner membrane lipoprotein YiaD precursor [Thiorhodovibrio frisius]